MSRSNSWLREPARSSSSSRSWVLRSSESLRPTSTVSAARRAFSRLFSCSSSIARENTASFSGDPLSGCRMANSWSFRRGAPVLQIIAPAAHQSNEGLMVLGQDCGAQPLDGLGEGFQRLGAVVVEALYFIIQLGTLLGDAAGDIELRIEGGARDARQFWGRFTADGECVEERDVERVRKTEHVGDQPVVIIEAHDDLLGHGGREQLAHRG